MYSSDSDSDACENIPRPIQLRSVLYSDESSQSPPRRQRPASRAVLDSDESSQSPPRRRRPASRAISPDYDLDSEPEEVEEEHLAETDSEQSQNHSIDFDIDDTESLVIEEETDDDSDVELHTMPTTRRSARRSGASSLNSTASSNDSNSAGPSTRANSPQLYDSSGTEEYDISQPIINASPQQNQLETSQVIEINDTQIMGTPPVVDDEDEDDDDVILIPENIETIDLCTQMFPTPRAFRVPMGVGEVIEIEDSPMTQQQMPPVMTARSPRSGPTRNNRGRENARTVAAPYVLPTAAKASTPYAKRLILDDSMDDGPTQSVKISCPICLESIIGRQPVSTICGHLFCKQCIKAALQATKKCPMCKKTLKAANIHDIYLGV